MFGISKRPHAKHKKCSTCLRNWLIGMRPKGSWSREKKRKPPGWVKLLYLKSLLDFIGQNGWLGKAGVGCWHSACRWPDLSLPPALPSACSLWAWDWFIFGSVPSSHWLRVKGQESHRSPDLLGCSGLLCVQHHPHTEWFCVHPLPRIKRLSFKSHF